MTNAQIKIEAQKMFAGEKYNEMEVARRAMLQLGGTLAERYERKRAFEDAELEYRTALTELEDLKEDAAR